MTEMYYTVYDRGDNVVAFGTGKEAAAMLGITLGSFYSAVSNWKSGRKKCAYEFVVEALGRKA